MKRWLLAIAIAGSTAAGAQETPYDVDPALSSLEVRVGKAGLFKFAGHEHVILAPRLSGRVVAAPLDIARSSVELRIEAGFLAVSDKGEPPEDVPKVQAKMLGAELLDVARFPSIEFRSKAVAATASGAAYDLKLQGELSLHGVTKGLELPVHVEIKDGRLTATGQVTLRQTDFALTPISVAGVVKVKNEVVIDYRIVAVPAR